MKINRRDFLKAASLPFLSGTIGQLAWAASLPNSSAGKAFNNLLILIELKGANDGLNTVIPFADADYYTLRPKIAIARDQVIKLNEATGLHPMLAKFMPLWEKKELAIVQGVGYPNPNQSHFRSIEIWDTASNSEEYLDAGWLARAFNASPTPKQFAADGVVVGSNDMGPLSGGGIRAIALANTEQFLRQAKLAQTRDEVKNAALKHILSVENEVVHAASKMNANYKFTTEFPKSGFGNQVHTAAQLVASNAGMAVIRLTLTGFDTHANQAGTQANLLRDLGDGLEALKSAMLELNRWDSTLVMTYAEFGRRPKENQSSGTDHGTANVHFMTGGKVQGGLYGQAPQLNRLDGNGNLPFGVDFRSLYATAMEGWWGVDSKSVLNGKFATLPILKA